MTAQPRTKPQHVRNYDFPDADSPLRPDVGTQAQFPKRKNKTPQTYRYDSSLSPSLDFDSLNPAREQGEQAIRHIEETVETALQQITAAKTLEEAQAAAMQLKEAQESAAQLKALGRPFLNWAGKAERLSFDVPTLPLFVHERLSTQAIIETLKNRKPQLDMMTDLFADPRRSVADMVLRSYEHGQTVPWTNRMILGDSLVVMNSLLHYESMGGKVQMIYMDPPYGVKFGSNFQPFVRKRDVSPTGDDDMTREPEMVQAYRDTWELGLHSYLTYLRDRLLLARDLLTPSGSIFVQISDENLHHVREVMDEVFGDENFMGLITFAKTTGATVNYLPGVSDYLLWYARDAQNAKYHPLYETKAVGVQGASNYNRVLLPDGTRRYLTADEKADTSLLPKESKIYSLGDLTSQSVGRQKGEGSACWFPIHVDGKDYFPSMQSRWKTNEDGIASLLKASRIEATGNRVGYVRYLDDFPVYPINDNWADVAASFMADKYYVVQTVPKVVQRCILMTTDPGDLVIDPTCGSGTTAYVAEEWGRRWITIDTSRVPLALARQRLLTATFPYYDLKDETRGPASGFIYKRKQNKKGEEVGGIVPHITLKSIANNEQDAEEILVDRPEVAKGNVLRVSGPFTFEATIPTPFDWDSNGLDTSGAVVAAPNSATYADRMLEVLRRSPMIRLANNETITFRNVRPPARTLSLSAEAFVEASAPGQTPTLAELADEADEINGHRLPLTARLVAIVFGPENGAVSEKLVVEASREAHIKGYAHLYVVGFAIQPNARQLVENSGEMGVPATYVQATPDLMMGDLLKHTRSSQIFSVCGLPDIKLNAREDGLFSVELRGLDVFDPVSMEIDHRRGDDVPAWFLDIDYDASRHFNVCQAFFPRTAAWDNLKKALKSDYDAGIWDHLAGTVSAPFELGDQRTIAVKVIDDRGNELLVEKRLEPAR